MAFGGARGRASHEEWIGGRLRSQRSRGVVGVRRGYQVLLALGRDADWCGRELEMRGRGAVEDILVYRFWVGKGLHNV